MKELGLFLVLLIVVGIIYYVYKAQTQIMLFSESKYSPSLTQYSGSMCYDTRAIYWYDTQIGLSNSIEIDNYKFVITMYNMAILNFGCKSNDCNAPFVGNDGYGCPLYEGDVQTTREYWEGSCSGCSNLEFCTCYSPSFSVQCNFNIPQRCYSCTNCGYFTIHSTETLTRHVTCGGADIDCNDNQGYPNWNPSYTVEIYKSGTKIDTVGNNIGSCGDKTSFSYWSDGIVEARFGDQIYYGKALSHNFDCMLSTYKFKISDSEVSPNGYVNLDNHHLVGLNILPENLYNVNGQKYTATGRSKDIALPISSWNFIYVGTVATTTPTTTTPIITTTPGETTTVTIWNPFTTTTTIPQNTYIYYEEESGVSQQPTVYDASIIVIGLIGLGTVIWFVKRK